jgi:hypothetical protein
LRHLPYGQTRHGDKQIPFGNDNPRKQRQGQQPKQRDVGHSVGLGLAGCGWDVVKADEVDVFAGAVFGDFEQVEDAEEAGGAG